MTDYVLGFMFNPEGTRVALIRKNKPAWQKGCLNGVGGKIERLEPSIEAMTREFLEETGVYTSYKDWVPFTTLYSDSFSMQCFKAFTDKIYNVTTIEEEIVGVFTVEDVLSGYEHTISNLSWLIPLALDKSDSGGYSVVAKLYETKEGN